MALSIADSNRIWLQILAGYAASGRCDQSPAAKYRPRAHRDAGLGVDLPPGLLCLCPLAISGAAIFPALVPDYQRLSTFWPLCQYRRGLLPAEPDWQDRKSTRL